MALSDLSFKFYTDSGLTTPFGGTYSLTHQTDLSDNPQNMSVLYFGSQTSTATLRANSNPGVDNITLTPTSILPVWTASTAYTQGSLVEPTVGNGYRYEATTGGTSDVGEPTWPTSSVGQTVADNSITWTLVSARHEETEIKLALTSGGLDSATGGAALSLGTSISGGSANAKTVYIRITNAVTTAGSNVADPEIGININEVIET